MAARGATFLQAAAAASAAVSAGCDATAFKAFFQKHYTELTDKEKKKIFERIERQTKELTGVDGHRRRSRTRSAASSTPTLSISRPATAIGAAWRLAPGRTTCRTIRRFATSA